MSIFLLSAVPLGFFLYISIEYSGIMATKLFWKSFILGGISFIVSLILLTVLGYPIHPAYEPVPLFVYHWFMDLFFFALSGTLGFLFFYYRGILVFERRKDFPFVYSFFSGFLSPAGVYILIKKFYFLDTYILFLYPLLLVVLGFITTFLVLEVQRSNGYRQILLFIIMIPATAVLAGVPALYYLNYHTYAVLLSCFLPLLSSSIYSILRNDYHTVFNS